MKWRAFKKDKNRQTYTCRGRDHRGIERTVPAFADKELSRELARRIAQLARHKAAGSALPPGLHEWAQGLPPKIRSRLAQIGLLGAGAQPLSEHVDDFEAHLRARGNTERHVKETRARLDAVVAGAGVVRLSDLTPSRLSNWIESRLAAVAPTTVNADIRAVKSFSRFCWRDGRLPADPLVGLSRIDPKGDLRHRRKALSEAEIGKLLSAARRSRRTFRGLDGEARHALYVAALGSGFRAGELASLRVQDLRLEERPPCLALAASDAKNRQEARQVIREEVADVLASFVGHRLPSAVVWPGSWHDRASRMVSLDLLEAGLARQVNVREKDEDTDNEKGEKRRISTADADGRVVDFHCLRTTYTTRFCRAGVSLALAQKLSRHSDPRLTSNVYTRLERVDEAAALDALPTLETTTEREAATGTAGAQTTPHTRGRKRGQFAKNPVGSSRVSPTDREPETGEVDDADSTTKQGEFALVGGEKGWGERGDSNPRPPDPQSGALTS